MRIVPINLIPDGSQLAKTLYSSDGRVLLRAGITLDGSKLSRASQMGFKSLYINDGFSTNTIDDLIDPQTRVRSVKQVKESYDAFENYAQESNKGQSNQWKLSEMRYEYLSGVKNTAQDIVDVLLNKKSITINIQDVKQMEEYLYQHTVNVAVLSVLLGMDQGLTEEDLENLAIGALFHDIGYNFISKSILNKPAPLINKEWEEIKTHANLGYQHLKDDVDINSHIRMIVLQHHEWINGSGYPHGLTADNIHHLSKIVAIADVYDALTSDRPYRAALPANEAIEFLLGHANQQLDENLVKSFIKLIIPYPVGTLVKLSNGEIGLVERLYENFPLRPVIKVIRQLATTVEMVEIDLMKEQNIVIEGVQYELPNYSVGKYVKE
ncbi:HD-GYP domain-containing protein [Fusibacter sp. JL216-2]|uniref:HD-GYP domain-containing protein n=1 Tax=Fusibacter sp. JL216-2 TaxID=3071453 RepID=UPI003D34C110